MVATDSFEMSTYRLSTDCSSSELRGNGGNGKSRTFTEHRMKVLHYRYATLPYRNTLDNHHTSGSYAGYVSQCVFIW